MELEERKLIQNAQQGDQRAFEILVSRYDRRVLTLAYDMARNVEDAQDIFQETLIAAYRSLPGFRFKSAFFTWLYRIAVNKALNFQRRQSYAPFSTSETDAPNQFADPGGDPEHQLLNTELQAQIDLALEALSPHERMAFILCHHQGLKMREAAHLMTCSDGAIKSYLFRARKKMKCLLQHYLEN